MGQVGSDQEIVGCIHIHSRYSDGSGTIPEISAIAREAGLDYIMITDHNNLRALQNGEEGWYGNVLTIIGYEINDIDDTNHYLAFGLQEEINKNLPAPEYVRQVRTHGGFGIIAHPDEERNRLPEHPAYPWTAWDSKDYQGIEIWNQMSEWMEGLTPWNKLWRFINPRKSILAPQPRTLSRWDQVNMERKVVGIGGVDAHAHKYEIWGGLIRVTIFRYKIQFKTIRTHLLLSHPLQPGMDVEEAKKIVFDSLLNCRVFVSNYFNGDARGFRCHAENSRGRAQMGDSLPFREPTHLHIRLPARGSIRLIREGKTIRETETRDTAIPLPGPGIYRVEVYRKNRAWIYTNHFRITRENEPLD